MDVSIAKQNVHAGDLVDRLDQLVEFLEATDAGALHSKATELGIKLCKGKREIK